MVYETHLYDLLLVPATASNDQIAKSYKKLALRYHPDKTNHNPESTEKFKDLLRAYEILKDPQQRQIYDAYGEKGLDGSLAEESEPQAPTSGRPNRGNFGFEQAVFSQLFSDMSSAFNPAAHFAQTFGQAPFSPQFLCDVNYNMGDPGFANMAGASRSMRPDFSRKKTKPAKGDNIYHNFKVSLADMYHGKEAKFSLPKMTKCTVCSGAGCFRPKKCGTCEGSGRLIILLTNQFTQVQEQRECHFCSGTGTVCRAEDVCKVCENGYKMESKILRVSIPPGAKNGDKCILTGQADEGKDIVPGDVVIQLEEIAHPFLVRQKNDLFMEYDIDLKTALLGGRVVVLDFPRMGEDVILYINVHGKKRLNDSVHPMINTGEVVGTINLGTAKLVKGLGMPINDAIKNGKFHQKSVPQALDEGAYRRGDLYIKFNVQLPEISEFAGEDDLRALQQILPGKPARESFGTVAWEHHLAGIPEFEPMSTPVEVPSSSGDEQASSEYDYEQLDVDSQDGSEEQEDDHFYASEWSKEHDGKRRKTAV